MSDWIFSQGFNTKLHTPRSVLHIHLCTRQVCLKNNNTLSFLTAFSSYKRGLFWWHPHLAEYCHQPTLASVQAIRTSVGLVLLPQIFSSFPNLFILCSICNVCLKTSLPACSRFSLYNCFMDIGRKSTLESERVQSASRAIYYQIFPPLPLVMHRCIPLSFVPHTAS